VGVRNRDRGQMKGREEGSKGQSVVFLLKTSRIRGEREDEEEGRKEQEDAY